MTCSHAQWLTLTARKKEIALLESDRVRRLVSQLTTADDVYPSMFTLFGADAKVSTLKTLLPSNVNEGRRRGCVSLHMDSASNPRIPLLYASCPVPFPFKYGKSSWEPRCHGSTRSVLSGKYQSSKAEAARLFTNILHPFSDAFCFFYNDFRNWEQIANGLIAWLDMIQNRTPKGVNPVLLFVVESTGSDESSEQEAKLGFRNAFNQSITHRLSRVFSNIEVVCLTSVADPTSKPKLVDYLATISARMQHCRRDAGVLFSATHLEAMLQYTVGNIIENKPLNLIESSRTQNPVPAEILKNMSNFLAHFTSYIVPEDSAVAAVASALLLDASPPGMHRFLPGKVFDTLYQKVCLGAGGAVLSERGNWKLQPSNFVSQVRAQFCHMTEQLHTADVETAWFHRNNLEIIFKTAVVSDYHTCLMCLVRNAEPYLTLSCGHRMCETCFQIYGWNIEEHPWSFRIDECPLCKCICDPPLIARLRNPCRGLRVLILDGGGCRGIIPLTFLQVLQNRMGLPYPVQENFDVAYGPSLGGLIILALFMKGLPIKDAVCVFKVLAKKAFEDSAFLLRLPRVFGFSTWIFKLYRLVVAYFMDSYYPADQLEDGLKQVFGEDMTMSNSAYAASLGFKVGIPVTTAVGCDPCLVTNYQGQAQPCHRDYRMLFPGNNFLAAVWLIARGTSAAPWFFRPKHIREETFQDGGLWSNNPVSLVDSEIEAIDPGVKAPLVVSVGTGLSKDQSRSFPTNSIIGWRSRFIPRLYEALMKFMCGKRLWNDYQRKGRAGTSLRFDVPFEGKEPRLDQVDRMEEMEALAEQTFNSGDVDRLAYTLISSLFHFEFESAPRSIDGHYSGYIMCDFTHHHPAFQPLLEKLSDESAQFLFNDQPIDGEIGDESYIDCRGDLRKKIKFQGSGEEVTISLKFGKASRTEIISGSPFSIPHRVRAQGLDAVFGEANHRKRTRGPDLSSIPRDYKTYDEFQTCGKKLKKVK